MAKTEKKQARRNPATKKLTGDVAKAVEAALDKKASAIVVLDLRQTPAFTDYFVLCSGQNQRQVKAIADAIEELAARRAGEAGTHRATSAGRVLMDFFTFIVHVFRRKRASSIHSNGCGVTLSASKWATDACDALVAVLLAPVCAACRLPLDTDSWRRL